MVGWPHGLDGGRERAPRPAVHDESGSAFWGVGGHAAISGGLGGAGWRRLRRASLWRPQSRRWRRSRGGAPPPARRRRPQASRRSCGAGTRGRGRGARCQRGYWRDRGDVLKKTTAASELHSEFTELDIDNALQVFDRMIWQADKLFLELGLGEVTSQCTQRLPDFSQIFRRRI